MEIRNGTAVDIGRICELLGLLWPDVDVNTAGMRRCFGRGLHGPNQSLRCAGLAEETFAELLSKIRH